MTVLYLVGAPGVGKTSLARALLRMQGPELPIGSFLVQKPKWTVAPHMCAAGHYQADDFDGADMVPYNGAQEALDYWAQELRPQHELTLLDGDRFSHEKALTWLMDRDDVAVAHLTAPDDVHAARRALRGSDQNATWVKGRVTKASRFADIARGKGCRTLTLDATTPTRAMLGELRRFMGLP